MEINRKAVALLSGGLDSILAIHLIKEQGIEIEAINFQTMFGCCKDDARRAAYDLGVGFTLLKVGDDYLKMVQKPKHGYGKGINPCVDCRGYMFDLAKAYMEKIGATFMISGEVVGQRPMSQKMSDFVTIEADTGLEGRIVRPLSAKLLPETWPEKQGILDRSKLCNIQGRSRKYLLELADKYGIKNPPDPSSGCALTSPAFAKKVRDIFKYHKDYKRWEFEILKMGRHFRLSAETKLIVGRNHDENQYFEYLHPEGSTLLVPQNFAGSSALLVGVRTPAILDQAGAIILRYADKPETGAGEIQAEQNGELLRFSVDLAATEEMVELVRIV